MIKKIWDWLFNPCKHDYEKPYGKTYDYWVKPSPWCDTNVRQEGQQLVFVCKKCGHVKKVVLK